MSFLLNNKSIYLFPNVVAALCLSSMLWSCDNGQEENPMDKELTQVRFTSGSVLQLTRGSWEGDERIGVYMIGTGAPLEDASIVDEADNREYTANNSGESSSFDPVIHEEAIYYPMQGSVDFIAYAPYRKNGTGAHEISNYVYPVNVTDQADPAAIDFLYATAMNQDKTNLAVALRFEHILSKVVFHIRKGAGHASTDFSGLTAILCNVPLSAGYHLDDLDFTTGSVGDITALAVEAGVRYEAIVIPQPQGTARSFVFRVDGEDYIWEVPDDMAFRRGNENVFTVTVSRANVTVESQAINKWTVSSEPVVGEAD